MSNEQYKILLTFRRHGGSLSHDRVSRFDAEDVKTLIRFGYLKCNHESFIDPSFRNTYRLTGEGKSAMHDFWVSNYRWWIPVIISLIAIIISIISLVYSVAFNSATMDMTAAAIDKINGMSSISGFLI